MKIYTKTGDSGETSLFDNTRVSKADARVDAYGEIDELNAALGAARAAGTDPDLSAVLEEIQKELFAIGAKLADPAQRISARVTKVEVVDSQVARLETTIDRLEGELPPLRRFILPGGSAAGSLLHLARTVCRRAERRVVPLTAATVEGNPVDVEADRQSPAASRVDPVVVMYLNRLSDLLFVMARAANHRAGVPETEW